MWVSEFLASTLVQTTPILLAALGTMITSRANILNVAIEGMALVAAFAAVAVGKAANSALLGFASAVAGSTAMALLFGSVAIGLGADFIVAGLGLNILAAGGTLFILEEVYQDPGGLRPDTFPDIWHVPANSLHWLPVLGPALERQSFIVLLALAAVPLCALLLYRTPFGYALRAVGEDEQAAVAAGIHASRMKLFAVLISGVFAGLAGAQLAMDRLHFFLPDMTSGRGFHRPHGRPFRQRHALADGRRGASVRRVRGDRRSPPAPPGAVAIRADGALSRRPRRIDLCPLACGGAGSAR